VNFGRVGFLASIHPNEFESGLARVFSGDYRVVQLSTLDVDAGGRRGAAVNDVVVLSAIRGRMVELAWALGGEDVGVQPCDGMICATPSGSTAYNLSNGGPVLVRGLDAMAVTFIAAHSLHARPMVVPRGLDLEIRNQTPDVDVTVLVDGHVLADVGRDVLIVIRLGEKRSLLASLPEATFFRRYRETFGS
jgi:NAD+ kinase